MIPIAGWIDIWGPSADSAGTARQLFGSLSTGVLSDSGARLVSAVL